MKRACDQSTADRIAQLEQSMRVAFEQQDTEQVLALDAALLVQLTELKQQELVLPDELRARIKELYGTIQQDYQGQYHALRSKLAGMRQNRTALNAYQQSQMAGF